MGPFNANGSQTIPKGYDPRGTTVHLSHCCEISNKFSIQILQLSFPTILESACRADQVLEWQLAALDALSIWLFRANKSSEKSSLIITQEEWDELISLIWNRWSSAPNATAIHKILKEIFSKALMLQRYIREDWSERETELLKKICLMGDLDMKIQCYLIELLVSRIEGGAKKALEIVPDWVSVMLAKMKDSGVGPTVGKCTFKVLRQRRSEIFEEDDPV